MKYFTFFVVLYAGFYTGFGQDVNYAVSGIPAQLMTNASAVIRKESTVFEIHARNQASQKVTYAVTILNSKGSSEAVMSLHFDKLTKIAAFNGTLYDANGKLIRKLRNNEIREVSEFEHTGYSDSRWAVADLTHATYPYTVVFECELEFRYLYEIPDLTVSGTGISRQHVEYRLVFPAALRPRYKCIGFDAPTEASLASGKESLTWTLNNIGAAQAEPYALHPETSAPRVLIAPSVYDYDGYPGDMTSWEKYGAWIYSLGIGRDALPEATREKVMELTKGLTADRDKAKVLYEYLQSRTRYVNISLGIGGVQPFPAETVDRNGYGDCKALSNYMIALLKVAGVNAHYATIMAGDFEADVVTDFPGHQANHAIVAVPLEQDTLWLECTDRTNPFGYMGTFTGNRKALLVTAGGGVLVHTHRYPESGNRQSRSAEIELAANGSGTGKVKTLYSGLLFERGALKSVLHRGDDTQKQWILENTEIPSFELRRFRISQERGGKSPAAGVDVELTLNSLASVSGKRMFLVPNLMNRNTFLPPQNPERKSPILIRMGYTETDTIRYAIPEEIYPEYLPDPVIIESSFGEYRASVHIDQGKLLYVRKLVVREGKFPSEKYPEFVGFYKKVSKADQGKIVFLSKT